ncbi:LRR receptor-like serine/threonine-protein kinase ERECTA [Durio zibethinus]|uniref:LRR receptor-like serine/threonine-protein kinase ERECTA n=1 Tax=Durio zibethinus TaxID=66656 RepID=A0A6P6AGC0_DURZI|nr:LRR receptor-like serine/threonine-protein kinase ERECTA [Durio zibethinus]
MNNFSADSGMLFLLITTIICCNFGCSQGCLDDEKTALQQIGQSLGYGYEYFYPGSSDDCCRWDGIYCSPTTSHVIRIFYDYIKEDEDPGFPVFLDMSLFSQLKELQELHLRGNNIGELTNPEEICKLVHLQWLDLSANSIEDAVPPCWGNMPSLRTLNLSKNRFQGNLTSFLANLSKIESIDVSYNLFEGLLSFSIFANHSKLSHLDLSYNYQLEVETENPTWHPRFQVQHLLLAGCNLNRQSGQIIPRFLSIQYNLQTLDLSSNLLVGSFPTWLLHNVSSVLSLRSNSFVGQFPQGHQKKSTLSKLDISNNHFDGHLPINIDLFLPQLKGFNASSNQFSGNIPPSVVKLKYVESLDLSSNLLSGVVPVGLTYNSPLWYLNLSNNSLDGELLPENCSMPNLTWLLLHHNIFVGNIPACLSKSLSLKLIDVRHNHLSGTILSLPVFMQLGALLLGENQFRGPPPQQLCQMQMLQFLDFSNNNFSGNIPSCLNNNSVWRKKFQANSWVPVDFTTKGNSYLYQGIPLTLMTGIDFSANILAGFIPDEIGELAELRSLNLSQNHLTGHIPKSFKNLTNLESLDLSHNNLTGQIPPEIVQIDFLTTFFVAFNNLSGRIPSNEHFSTIFSESSFEGNQELCGEPLQRKCSGNDNEDDGRKENPKENAEEGLVDKPLFFYSFVFVSYAVGFWSVIAPLCIGANWRRKYFATIDGWIEYLLTR